MSDKFVLINLALLSILQVANCGITVFLAVNNYSSFVEYGIVNYLMLLGGGEILKYENPWIKKRIKK